MRNRIQCPVWILVFLLLSVSFAADAATPRVHALTGARIVVAPGRVVENGTLLLRDGLVQAVGSDVRVPADARVWNLTGSTLYPGLIDVHVPVGRLAAEVEGRVAPEERLQGIRAAVTATDGVRLDPEKEEELRNLGFTVVRLVPTDGLFRGRGAVVALRDAPLAERTIRRGGSHHLALGYRGPEDVYPSSLMGAIAMTRQTLMDAGWYAEAHRAYARRPRGQERPRSDAALEALRPAAAGEEPVVFEGSDVLDVLRAASIARELDLEAQVVGSGEEYLRMAEVAATGLPLILPVDFPQAPKAEGDAEWVNVPLARLRHWDRAPSNPYWLDGAGVPFALTTYRLKSWKAFPKKVHGALERGLSGDVALAALTTVPAGLLGMDDVLGTLERGKVANVVEASGDLFAEGTRVEAVWVDGERHEIPEEGKKKRREEEDEEEKTPEEKAAEAEEKEERDYGAPRPLPAREAGPIDEADGFLIRNATVWTLGPEGTLEEADVLVRDGRIAAVGIDLTAPAGIPVVDAGGRHLTPGIVDCHSHTALVGEVNEGTDSVSAEVRICDIVNSEDPNIYRLLAGGLTTMHLLHGSANTIGGQNCAVKLRWGEPPEGLFFEEARPTIKFALGENVKQSNWGDRYRTRFPQTRMGVEQVSREAFAATRDYMAEWEEWRRKPRSVRAREIPPRRDLRLETLAEILRGELDVHAHSYRQDEILMLMRVAEEFGFTIGTFQHILEGYKVADEMAAHGAHASAFSDWWAYKFEVYDAIPYNGAIMWDRGVVVSFNSDSTELARRLNLEAAKAVKYGGLPEEEALRLVTLNPAIQLGVGDRIGSIEPGKDADLALWSGHPLSGYSIAEQVWIEGIRYFDREADLRRRVKLREERAGLIEAAKAGDGGGGAGGGGRQPAEARQGYEPPQGICVGREEVSR